jgi:bifunctional DNA-binding transcriptional regulator/antitoxin component of YhaV-PrlF toxin-antitoxin module
MNIQLTTLGERGQAVIPKTIRDQMPAPKGTMFSIMLIDEDTIVMKRFDKRKLVAEFRDLRKSIKKKLSDAEIMNEIKKSRQA